MKDPIVEEVRAAREAHAAKFGYDLQAILEDARRHQRLSGHRVIDLSATPAARQSRRALTARRSASALGPGRARAAAANKRSRQHA
jgi:hypothetical protein